MLGAGTEAQDVAHHRIQRVVAAAFLAAALVSGAAGVRATPVFEKPSPGRSEAYVDVRAAPAEVFAALSRPDRWTSIFTDVQEVEQVPKAPSKTWRVVSRLIGHAHMLDLRVEASRLVHFHLTDPGPGGSLVVELKLDAMPAGGTRVRYSLLTILPLGLGAVFDEGFLRRHREHKIRIDLEDIERSFGVTPPQPG